MADFSQIEDPLFGVPITNFFEEVVIGENRRKRSDLFLAVSSMNWRLKNIKRKKAKVKDQPGEGLSSNSKLFVSFTAISMSDFVAS